MSKCIEIDHFISAAMKHHNKYGEYKSQYFNIAKSFIIFYPYVHGYS
ncbi:MAG: hypothetical protein ACI37Q_04535 [Candidatus Gastranaerophilaceae bacterium]